MHKILMINQQVANLEAAARSLQSLLELAPNIPKEAAEAMKTPGRSANWPRKSVLQISLRASPES